jgi:hypothetical protein
MNFLNVIKLAKNTNSQKLNVFYKFSRKNFTYKPLSFDQKFKMIVDREQQKIRGKEEDIKFTEEKTIPLISFTQKIRFPVYLSIPCLIWAHPISIPYSGLILFSNYYMIFLTTFEATSLFCLGLNQMNLQVGNFESKEKEIEFLQMKRSVTRKRLFIMIIFFTFMILAAINASDYNSNISLGILFLSNIYLYAKFGLHVTLYGLNKTTFTRRSKYVGMNLFLILSIWLVSRQKDKFIVNNLQYKA